MIDLCKKCFELNTVGSFYCNQAEAGKHLTGYIAAYCEDEMIIKHISPDGYYDGFILLHISDLIRIDMLGQYEQKVSALYVLRKQHHPFLDCSNNSYFPTLMDFASENGLVVTVELDNSVISGFVEHYNEHMTCLQVINEFGLADGTTILINDSILSVAVDTSHEQNLKLLSENDMDN